MCFKSADCGHQPGGWASEVRVSFGFDLSFPCLVFLLTLSNILIFAGGTSMSCRFWTKLHPHRWWPEFLFFFQQDIVQSDLLGINGRFAVKCGSALLDVSWARGGMWLQQGGLEEVGVRWRTAKQAVWLLQHCLPQNSCRLTGRLGTPFHWSRIMLLNDYQDVGMIAFLLILVLCFYGSGL